MPDPVSTRRLIVTHHAPDLDAITSVWLLKRFDAQHFAEAAVGFVNPGDVITSEEAQKLNGEYATAVHVDTGHGMFDHHQAERGAQFICAASLVFHDHLCHIHPEIKKDPALQSIISFVTEIDHFQEVHWPEADHFRYEAMIHSLIHGLEFTDPHDDTSQLHFGMKCLDSLYATLTQYHKALEIIKTKGQELHLQVGKGLALSTRNQETVKLAQKQGYVLVVTKDPKQKNIRIKARPDSSIDLTALHDSIKKQDPSASWYLHPSGKMLLNGSSKWRGAVPSTLSLETVCTLLLQHFGTK